MIYIRVDDNVVAAFWEARPEGQSSLSAEDDSLVYSGGRVVIRIKDNGAGISPANQKLLFHEGVVSLH